MGCCGAVVSLGVMVGLEKVKNKNGGWQAVAGRWFLVFYCMRNYRQPVAENHQRWPIS
jgi:hypothetical protein